MIILKPKHCLKVSSIKSNLDVIHIYNKALDIAKTSKTLNEWHEKMLCNANIPNEFNEQYKKEVIIE